MMGTGQFALPTFLELCESPHQVVGLFTQPDRTGRGHHKHRNLLKEKALEHGTPVFQPQNVNLPESLADLKSLDADICVVAAYGQLLSAELLATPKMGAINLHASLLPKFRGAAPVQYAVWKGEAETGVTIFQIEPKLDAGPILGVLTTPIGPKETSGELETRLASLAVPLTLQVLNQLEAGTVQQSFQDKSLVTKAPRLKKTDGSIGWEQTAAEIDCQIRAMQPWPKPSSFLHHADHSPLRILVLDVERSEVQSNQPPGTIIAVDHHQLVVQTGQGTLSLLKVQPEGKRAMAITEFLNGHALQVGDRFQSE
jgi:methionyl-tRNA formyltransferase